MTSNKRKVNNKKTTGKIFRGNISSKLNLEAMLTEHKPNFNYKIDHFYYLLNLLAYLPYKSKKSIDSCGYVTINSEAFNNHVRNGSKILKYLIENGVLISRPYTKGEISKGYRYAPNYEGKLIEIEFRDKPYMPRKKKYQQGHTLFQHLNKFNKLISFDTNSAKKWISEQPDYYINKKDKKVRFDKNLNESIVERLGCGEFCYPSFPDNFGDGRIYTQMSNIKSQYRHYFLFQGDYFSELDITSSQILASIRLFSPNFYTTDKTGDLVTLGMLSKKVLSNLPFSEKEIWSFPTSTSIPAFSPPTFSSSYMYGKTSVTCDTNSVFDYCSHASEGNFYIKMMDKLKQNNEFVDIKKEKAKKLIWRIINSKKGIERIKQPDYSIPLKIFKDSYPDVHSYFQWFKSKDPKNLCRTLSNIESILILKRIVPRFIKEFPGIPIYPIHDSVICPKSYINYMETIVIEETEKFIGVKPPYKIKDLSLETVTNLKAWKV